MTPAETTSPAGTGHGQAAEPGEPPIYCLVPPDLSQLWEPLCRHFAGNPDVEVMIDQRRRERRAGIDRRDLQTRGARDHVERRLADGLEGRRFSERRAIPIPVGERPALSPDLYCYAEQLRFVRRFDGSPLHREVARLRVLAGAWRDRCRDAESEANGLLRALVRVADDLGRVKSWSPRKTIALHRAQQTIEHFRQSHLGNVQAPGSNGTSIRRSSAGLARSRAAETSRR
jgi:hypothetical protein